MAVASILPMLVPPSGEGIEAEGTHREPVHISPEAQSPAVAHARELGAGELPQPAKARASSAEGKGMQPSRREERMDRFHATHVPWLSTPVVAGIRVRPSRDGRNLRNGPRATGSSDTVQHT